MTDPTPEGNLPPVYTFTIPVAFAVFGTTRAEANERLLDRLRQWCLQPSENFDPDIDCWWVATDDRIDGSDNDSAVFVPIGCQEDGYAAVEPIHQAAYARSRQEHAAADANTRP